jgi:hypothetical protein
MCLRYIRYHVKNDFTGVLRWQPAFRKEGQKDRKQMRQKAIENCYKLEESNSLIKTNSRGANVEIPAWCHCGSNLGPLSGSGTVHGSCFGFDA